MRWILTVNEFECYNVPEKKKKKKKKVFWFFDMLKYIYSESSFNTQYIDVMLKC